MKIGIDARSIWREGVGRYIRDLVHYLPRAFPEVECVLYLPGDGSAEDLGGNGHRVLVRRAGAWPRFLRQVAQDRLTLLHATDHWALLAPKPCRLIVTFHDLMIKTAIAAVPPKSRWYGRLVAACNIALADRVLTVSRFNAAEILRYYPQAAGRIRTVPHGIAPTFTPCRDPARLCALREKYVVPDRYLLYVGSFRRHKQVPALFRAFASLPRPLRESLTLVVAARLEPCYRRAIQSADAYGITDRVRLLGHVPTEDLVPLYSGALAFVTASEYESFCYPVAEAMACGTPVIAPDRLAFPEIAGNAGLLFDPADPHGLASAMERLATDGQLRAALAASALQRSQAFPLPAAMEQIAAVYREVLAS